MLLTALEAAQRQKFHTLVTGNESYLYLEYSRATKWCVCFNDGPPRVKTTITLRKFMLTVTWGVTGFSVMNLMTTPSTINSVSFTEQIMTSLVDKIYPGRRNPHDP
jgi:hypothetical protein